MGKTLYKQPHNQQETKKKEHNDQADRAQWAEADVTLGYSLPPPPPSLSLSLSLLSLSQGSPTRVVRKPMANGVLGVQTELLLQHDLQTGWQGWAMPSRRGQWLLPGHPGAFPHRSSLCFGPRFVSCRTQCIGSLLLPSVLLLMEYNIRPVLLHRFCFDQRNEGRDLERGEGMEE